MQTEYEYRTYRVEHVARRGYMDGFGVGRMDIVKEEASFPDEESARAQVKRWSKWADREPYGMAQYVMREVRCAAG